MENKTAQTNTKAIKRSNKAIISIIVTVTLVAGVTSFLTFVPVGRAITFAATNPGVVNNVANQQAEAIRNIKFVVESPKGQ